MNTWTEHQKSVFNWALNETGNAIVEAVAGSGKTTTLIEMVRQYSTANPNKKLALLAYNKKIAEELKSRIVDLGNNVIAGTVHSFGFSAIRKTRKYVKVDGYKLSNIFNDITNNKQDMKVYYSFVNKLVSLAKDTGIGIFSDINDRDEWWKIIDHHDLSTENGFEGYEIAIDLAIKVLSISNTQRDIIDFSDMIYQTLLFNLPIDQYDFVLVDEAQDTNSTRRELAARMVNTNGRSIYVGDSAQAIYGFTGADNDSMKQIQDRFNAKVLPLTVSFRCPQNVVKYAQNWVSHIQYSPTAIEGSVTEIEYKDLIDKENKYNIKAGDAVICRKNAPLLSLAFKFIKNGIGCRIEGRDIGTQLINLVKKWKVKNLNQLMERLEKYLERETEKIQKHCGNKQELIDAKIAVLQDRVDCLIVLIQSAQEKEYDIEGLIIMITNMFGDTDDPKSNKNLVVLSSVHRAKGLEWNRVFLLGRKQYMPSKWAKQQHQIDQENNLIYVAITRAKQDLIEVNNVPE